MNDCRTSSPGLDSLLKREVSAFAEELKKSSGLKSGQISLEFFQRKRTRWPFPPENIPWEASFMLSITINVVDLLHSGMDSEGGDCQLG